jgi:hypothetical protein
MIRFLIIFIFSLPILLILNALFYVYMYFYSKLTSYIFLPNTTVYNIFGYSISSNTLDMILDFIIFNLFILLLIIKMFKKNKLTLKFLNKPVGLIYTLELLF